MKIVKTLATQLAVWTVLLGPLAALSGAACPRDGPLPDLAVAPGSYRMEPANPTVGEEVKSFFTITNPGDADAINFTVDWFVNVTDEDHYLHPRPDNNFTIGFLAAGESQDVSMIWKSDNFAGGVNYTIIIILNMDRSMAESNYTNDREDQNITLRPSPPLDFYPSADEVWFDPSPPVAGDDINITATIHNGGQGNARFVDVFFFLNDTDHPLSGFSTLRDLNGSTSQNVSTLWRTGDLPAGLYSMLVYVNPPWSQDYIGETNATNNIVNVSVTLGQRLPDLTLLNVSWLPADPYVGQTLIVTAEVYNAGNGASPAADVSLFLDYNITALVTVQAPELAAGANGSVTLSWNTSGVSAGNHRLRAAVDPEYHIVESSKANNTFTWTLEFAGVLDLALLNLTVSPASPRPGDNVKFAVTVVNLGTLRCNSANLTLRVGGSVADHLQLLALAAGGVLNASLEWSTAGLVAGTYDCELSVAAGPGDNDTDGSNNMLGRTVQLLPPEPRPDLRIRSIVLSEQVVRTGDPLTLTVVIENAGNLDANASAINILLESSAGRLFRFTDSPMAVPGIAAGQAVTINISGDTSRFSPDNYTLDAAADYGSDVAESNESNNHFVMALGILAPLPKLPSVNVDDILIAGRLEEGQKVDLIAVVNNSGDGPAMDLLITFIVDGSVAGTQNLDQLAAHAIRNATLAWTFSPGSHTVRATVSAPGVAEVASQRSVTIQATASQYTSYLVAAALGVVLILLAAVMARGYTKSRSPGPRVKLVEEEE